MTRSITPGAACRLEFIVEDADGLPVPSMTDANVSSAAYRNVSAAGQASADTPVTLTSSSAAYTAAVSAGQFITIDSERGHYAIDCPSGAAGASAGYAEAVVTFTAGYTVTALLHEIDEIKSDVNSLLAAIDIYLTAPDEIVLPVSGTETIKIRLIIVDRAGNNASPDSDPILTLANAAGTDRSSRLSVVTQVTVGVYDWSYTNTAGDAEEQLIWTVGVIENTIICSKYRTSRVQNARAGAPPAVTLTLGATIPLTAGNVTGFSEPIVIGDDYTEEVGRRIIITLTDTNGAAIPVAYGAHSLETDCDIKALFHTEGKDNVKTAIQGSCEFNAASGPDPAFLLLTLPRTETAKAIQGTYQIQIEARWEDGFNITMGYSGTAKFTRDIARR